MAGAAGWPGFRSFASRLGVSCSSRIAGSDGLRLVPDTPPSDPAGLLRERIAELEARNERLRQAAADRDELAAARLASERARADSLALQVAALAARDAQIEALAAQVEELRRRLDKDSSTSSKPSSSDSPYKKKPKDRSLRGRSGRKPGKQPGAESSTLQQSDNPGRTVECGPAACGCCGHDLGDVRWQGCRSGRCSRQRRLRRRP